MSECGQEMSLPKDNSLERRAGVGSPGVARRIWTFPGCKMTCVYKNSVWLLLLILVVVTAGCGGGGGGEWTAAVTFTPNYISSLDGLYHWASLPASVYFDTPDEWLNHYSSQVAVDGALSWNIPGEQAFLAVADSAARATVVCSFVENPLPEWSGNAQAVTYYAYYYDSHLLVPGKVSITCAWRDRFGRVLSPQLMQGIIAHELGHALGISGHSPKAEDLMYSQVQSGLITPQERDINTVKTAYYTYFSPQPAGAPLRQPEAASGDIIYRTIE